MTTIDEIAAHMKQWEYERSRFRDNNDGGAFEPLDMEMERNAGEWLLITLTALERQSAIVRASRAVTVLVALLKEIERSNDLDADQMAVAFDRAYEALHSANAKLEAALADAGSAQGGG